MKAAVIGTGNIGAAYARALTEAKFDVVAGDRDSGKATALAKEIGPQAEGGGIAAAFKLADIALLALPYQEVAGVLAEADNDAAATAQVRELAQMLVFLAVSARAQRNSRFLEPVGMKNIQFGFFLGAGPTTAPSWANA